MYRLSTLWVRRQRTHSLVQKGLLSVHFRTWTSIHCVLFQGYRVPRGGQCALLPSCLLKTSRMCWAHTVITSNGSSDWKYKGWVLATQLFKSWLRLSEHHSHGNRTPCKCIRGTSPLSLQWDVEKPASTKWTLSCSLKYKAFFDLGIVLNSATRTQGTSILQKALQVNMSACVPAKEIRFLLTTPTRAAIYLGLSQERVVVCLGMKWEWCFNLL